MFEVDGKQVRARQSRLEELLRGNSGTATASIQSIINESARYNIGNIQRTIGWTHTIAARSATTSRSIAAAAPSTSHPK